MLFRLCRTSLCTTNSLLKSLKYQFIAMRTVERGMSTAKTTKRKTEEKKINVDGIDIHYIRAGSGSHPVLLLPGVLGTAWTDFKPQIEELNAEKFTIVAWDPPGYGKSRPPSRTFPDDFFHRDAAWAHGLMKNLGYAKFSLIGWSDGGITSLIISSTYPESINKLVVAGGNSYIMPEELEIYERIRNIDVWSEKMKAPLLEIYGDEYFRETWSSWIDTMNRIYETQKGDLCKDKLPKIKCPTLIIHGMKDVMVHANHPVYLKNHIAGAKLKLFEKGAHNLHLRYPEEFNNLVTEFLLE